MHKSKDLQMEKSNFLAETNPSQSLVEIREILIVVSYCEMKRFERFADYADAKLPF